MLELRNSFSKKTFIFIGFENTPSIAFMELTRESELIFFRERVNKQLTRVLSLPNLRETSLYLKMKAL